MMTISRLCAAVLLFMVGGGDAQSNPHGPALKKQDWSFQKPTGTFDPASLQRGFQVFKEVCSTCHTMKLLRYGSLTGIGLTMDEIKVLAAEYKMPDTNDDGEPIERKALPSDHFAKPYPNDKAARAANNGALPPDLSLITKARVGGADYVYSLLTGYDQPPAGVELGKGMHWNTYFPGGQIAMTPPLVTDGQVSYHDGTVATVDQMARDVVTFLSWAAEPEMEQRKSMGVKVLLYLLALTVVLYLSKRKIWKDVH